MNDFIRKSAIGILIIIIIYGLYIYFVESNSIQKVINVQYIHQQVYGQRASVELGGCNFTFSSLLKFNFLILVSFSVIPAAFILIVTSFNPFKKFMSDYRIKAVLIAFITIATSQLLAGHFFFYSEPMIFEPPCF